MFGKKKDDTSSQSPNDQVLDALKVVQDPDLGRDIVALGFIKNLEVDGERVSFAIELTTPACPVKDQMKAQADEAVRGLGWPKQVDIEMTASVRAAGDQTAMSVKNIIAVASGKGGVGKSTVATNLAFALLQSGANVGLLDADIYGPSIPHMLGVADKKPQVMPKDGKQRIIPVERDGLKTMSMGYLVDVEKPVIWRGPMLHSALRQFFGDVEWGELDYLVIDLPPGTGDAQLTMTQSVPVTGAVVVSTPQDVAMLDARKAVAMFRDTNVPVLGIVENMSLYCCPSCGHEAPIFGHGGAKKWSEDQDIRFLGAVPIHATIREQGDAGTPAVAADSPPAEIRDAFRHIAQQTAAEVSKVTMSRPTSEKLELEI